MSLEGIDLSVMAQVPDVWLREGNELGGHSLVPEDPGAWISEGKMNLMVALYLKSEDSGTGTRCLAQGRE
jgi:hypothetical protein